MHPQTWIGRRVAVHWPLTSGVDSMTGTVRDTTAAGFDLESEATGRRHFIPYSAVARVYRLEKATETAPTG
jgi:hypothetical protein